MTTVTNAADPVCGCTKERATFSDAWKTKVIADTGDHYLQPPSPPSMEVEAEADARHLHDKPTRPKLSIRGVVGA